MFEGGTLDEGGSERVYKEIMLLLKGEKVNLRLTEYEDLAFLQRLWNDGEVMRYVGYPNGLKMSKAQVEEWFHQIRKDASRLHLVIETKDGIVIGESGYSILKEDRLYDYKPPDDGLKRAWAELKLDKRYWGKGFGTEAMKTLIKYVFSHTDIDILLVTPHVENKSAQRIYETCGYKKTGIMIGECQLMELRRDIAKS